MARGGTCYNGPVKEEAEALRRRLRQWPPLVLDSAMGTQLERRGVESGLPLWSARALMEAPEVVLTIHREEAAAGADVLTANTFRTHRRTLAREGLADCAEQLTRKGVSLARQASFEARRPVFVAGSLSPLEDCYQPDFAPGISDLEAEHAEQARALAGAGVDLILAETHNTIRELQAAVRAAKETGLPVIASMVTDGTGRLLSGETIEEAASAVAPLSPDALSINCVPARRLAEDLRRLVAAAPAGFPLAAYGNTTRFAGELDPSEYANLVRAWLALGARVVGGCCGTTSAHTATLRTMVDLGRRS
jgi:methionine synthase I (cobalamin-dependent)